MKNFIFLTVVALGSLYVAIGDQIAALPPAMRTQSYQTRTAVVNFSTGLIPGWAKKDQNKRTQEAINKEEKGQPATK